MSNSTNFAAPMGCLSEHLDYFSESIVSKHPILDGDFDDIFAKDFDLVFDPELLAGGVAAAAAATPAAPAAPAPVVIPVQQQHQQQPQQQRPQVIPMAVPSASFVPPPPQTVSAPCRSKPQPVQPTSNSCVVAAPVTPAVPAKPIATIKPQATTTKAASAPKATNIRKAGPAVVSPTSVTAVFESIPAAAAAPKSSPRKRSYSTISTSAPKPQPSSKPAPVDTSNMSFEQQEDLRRERNRHHAKRSRQRKRDYMNQLEEAVNEMRKENERLFDLLGMDSTRAKADMAKEEERKAARATEKFIAGLKQPRNRVLDNTTLAFLRELWK